MPIRNDDIDKGMTGSGLIVLNTHKNTAQNLRGAITELQNCLKIENCKKRVIASSYLRYFSYRNFICNNSSNLF